MPDSQHATRPPSVDRVLTLAQVQQLISVFGRPQVTNAVRHTIDELRENHRSGTFPPLTDIATLVEQQLHQEDSFSLRRVINLTGTVLHTNLGRAALPPSAINTMMTVASGASNLEYDLDSGTRGDRDSHLEKLLTELTGAEAATVVNNNAAAVMLVLNTLASGQEVPVSRGELVEIGGSFRIPEIMSRSGCQLVEIGATNRTHLADYRDAVTSNTALLMKVHTSNYEIRGFTSSVSDPEVAALAQELSLPFVTDLGSGNLIDFSTLGLPPEPTVAQVIEAGADVVTFSGDKLLGGPQAGIVVGKRKFIEQIKRNPMKRALRVDKLTIAGLFEVLKLYRHPEKLIEELPTLRYLTRKLATIIELAEALCGPVTQRLAGFADVCVVDTKSQVGSGSLPLDLLPSAAIQITPRSGDDAALRGIARAFRHLPTPVVGRITDGSLLLDLRTLDTVAEVADQLDQLVLEGTV
jgi:L-seryl-tRNA(Ser) seleniumtransferase